MGNVYMEAEQVRFKNSTYRNVQEGLAAALEGGGGGGTTVVANPEGSATADLAKLQVGTTIYGIPAEAGDISYDNTSSGLTADDVQEAVDEVATDIGSLSTIIGDSTAGLVKEVTDIQDLIPSDATSSNKLATASDIPDAVTGNPSGSATAGNLTKLQIGSDIYNISGDNGQTAKIVKETSETCSNIMNRLYAAIDTTKIRPQSVLVLEDTSTGTNNVLPFNSQYLGSNPYYRFASSGARIQEITIQASGSKMIFYALGTASPLAPTYTDQSNNNFTWECCYIIY